MKFLEKLLLFSVHTKQQRQQQQQQKQQKQTKKTKPPQSSEEERMVSHNPLPHGIS